MLNLIAFHAYLFSPIKLCTFPIHYSICIWHFAFAPKVILYIVVMIAIQEGI